MPRNNTLTYRVAQLEKKVTEIDIKIEKKVTEIDIKIDRLLQNHVPRLSSEVASIRTSIKLLAAINVAAIILSKLL
jgi:hypothetical protein